MKTSVGHLTCRDELCSVLQASIPKQFFIESQLGVDCYVKGDWAQAVVHFKACLEHRPAEPAITETMRFMEVTGFKTPVDWPNYREL